MHTLAARLSLDSSTIRTEGRDLPSAEHTLAPVLRAVLGTYSHLTMEDHQIIFSAH